MNSPMLLLKQRKYKSTESDIETKPEAKQVTQKLKKKEQLESSLLDAINEHGEESDAKEAPEEK